MLARQAAQELSRGHRDSLVSLPTCFTRHMTLRVMCLSSIVVDGLDESTDLGSILQLLSELQTSQAIRIIVLSQFDQQISSALGPDCLSLDMTLHSHSDIHDYVKQKTSEFVQSKPLLESEQNSISERVLARSDGMFQWVSLVMHDLSRAVTVRDVDRCLEEFPHKLNSTYAGILQRLFLNCPNWWPRVKTALRWLATGARPLTIRELWLAIALQEGDQVQVEHMLAQGNESTPDDNEIENHFRTLLGPLVKITNLETEADLINPPRVIELCHSSLRQLLLSGQDLILKESTNHFLSNPCPPKNLAHAHCAEACLDLCASGLITLVDAYAAPHDVPLLGYFWDYCVYHLQHSAPLDATSKLPNKLDNLFVIMVDNTLILLDCISDVLSQPTDDDMLPSSTPLARRAKAATRMEKTVAIQTALESILPAVEALLALKQFCPIGEKLAQAERASNNRELGSGTGNPHGVTGWLQRTCLGRLKFRYFGVGNETSSFLRLALEEAIDDWPELLPTHLACSKPLATALKSLQTVTLKIVADPAYTRLSRIENNDFGPVLGLVSRAMMLEGLMNLPYQEFFRKRKRPLQDFPTSHFDCHSSDPFHGEIGIIRLSLGNAARTSPVLREPIPRRQHISYAHYVIVTGLLSLQDSSYFGLQNVFTNHWLKNTVLIPIDYVGFGSPEFNLEYALRQDGYFNRVSWNMSDFIGSIPAVFAIWVVKYLRQVLEHLGPYEEYFLQLYVISLKTTWLKLVYSFTIVYGSGLTYGLASAMLYLFRCRYFPSMGAAMLPFPDLVEALKDPRTYRLLSHPAPTRYFAALMCHTGVRYMAEALAPPEDFQTTPQSWRNRILYVYIGFCHMTRMERVICHMANILTQTFIYAGSLLVFYDDMETSILDLTLKALAHISISMPGGLISIAVVDSGNLRMMATWFSFWFAVLYYKDELVSVVLLVGLWLLRPIVTPLYSVLSVLADLRSLGTVALTFTALWAYSHTGTLMRDPYNLSKTSSAVYRTRALIRKHISKEMLEASKQKVINRCRDQSPVIWGTPMSIVPPAAIRAPALPPVQHSMASSPASRPPAHASTTSASTSVVQSPPPASLSSSSEKAPPCASPPPAHASTTSASTSMAQSPSPASLSSSLEKAPPRASSPPPPPPGKPSIRAAIARKEFTLGNAPNQSFAGMTRGFLVSRHRFKRPAPQVNADHTDTDIIVNVELDQASQIGDAGGLRHRSFFVHDMD
jgi:hypothetical protein